jgi:uncharacterized protein (TIGR02145 family)
MKQVSLILSAAFTLISLMLLTSCEGTYKEVKIGNQVWMAENLNVDKFRNGDPIPEAKTAEEWQKAGKNREPAWSYNDNDPANGKRYGKLYNWFAVNDPRGLAPEGWKIPSHEDWTQLKDFLGEDGGKKMKSTKFWADNDGESGNGNNLSGFSGLPGGSRYSNGSFNDIGKFGGWWSSTYYTEAFSEDSAIAEEDLWLSFNWHGLQNVLNGNVISYMGEYDGMGLSVRCVRD